MSKELIQKVLITLLLVAWYIWMPQQGYIYDHDDAAHFSYILCHANVWHLAGNLFVLWMIRGNLYLPSSLVIAILASFAPAFGSVWDSFTLDAPTMGCSGVIFAMCGVKWGKYIWRETDKQKKQKLTNDFLLKAVPFTLAGMLISHINWSLHLYCLMAGFVYGRCRR